MVLSASTAVPDRGSAILLPRGEEVPCPDDRDQGEDRPDGLEEVRVVHDFPFFPRFNPAGYHTIPLKENMKKHEVSVDAFGRIDVRFRGHQEHKFYVAEESDLGEILLLPAELVPAVRIITGNPLEGATGKTPSIEEIRERLKLPEWQDQFPYGGAFPPEEPEG